MFLRVTQDSQGKRNGGAKNGPTSCLFVGFFYIQPCTPYLVRPACHPRGLAHPRPNSSSLSHPRSLSSPPLVLHAMATSGGPRTRAVADLQLFWPLLALRDIPFSPSGDNFGAVCCPRTTSSHPSHRFFILHVAVCPR